MAELLCLARDHWTDRRGSGKPKEWSQEKYDRRLRVGDVVEVREDRFFRIEALGEGVHGWNRDAYFVVRIPWMTVAQAGQFSGAEWDNHEAKNKTMIRHRQYSVDWDDVQANLSMVGTSLLAKAFTERWLDIPNRSQAQKMKLVDKKTASEVVF